MRFDSRSCSVLFHGTGESLDGQLRPGGYDGVFWTAESSAVAQTYIPAAAGSTYVAIQSHLLDERVRPSRTDPCYSIAKRIGPAARDIWWDEFGRAKAWVIPEGYATYRDVVRHLEETLGYSPRAGQLDRVYELLVDGLDPETHESQIVPAAYRRPGSLVIVTGFQSMALFDMSRGESDLQDRQYHAVAKFAELAELGYDGVIIDDFAQSKTWGNVGHRSIGFFAHAMPQLGTEIIPAKRFDWSPTTGGLQTCDTPELLAWKLARAAAHAAKEDLPRCATRIETRRPDHGHHAMPRQGAGA